VQSTAAAADDFARAPFPYTETYSEPTKTADLKSIRTSFLPRNPEFTQGTANEHSMADINQSNNQPRITLTEASDYREGYANSVQVRASVWDFFLSFGTAHQDSPDQVTIRGFQGIYLSPQQAKALFNVLGQNLAQYEQAFGSISLEPLPSTTAHRPLN
jgi:hypothetical protein